jgi:hypothetical protein
MSLTSISKDRKVRSSAPPVTQLTISTVSSRNRVCVDKIRTPGRVQLRGTFEERDGRKRE